MKQFQHTAIPGNELIACHECDTLHRVPLLAPGRSARCGCCGAVLARHPKGGLDRPLAFNIAAAILLLLANAFPFLLLEIQGRVQDTTLIGASRALYEAGMGELAVVVFVTSVLGPALLIACSLYVLLGVRFAKPLPQLRTVLAWISHLKPWGMLDVFMLGVLVAFVKLAGMAEMVVGPALYAFCGLIVASTAAMSSFEPRLVWQRLGNMR